MPTVQTTFTSDISDYEKKIVKLTSENERLKESLKSAGKASKKAAEEAASGFERAGTKVHEMVLGLVTLETAVASVTAAYAEWRNVQKEVAEGELAIQRTAAGASFRSGGSPAGLDQIGLERVQRAQLLDQVRRDAPDLADQRAVGITGELAKLVKAGVGVGDVSDVASVAGQLAEINPSLSSDDALDAATSLQQSMRGDFGKLVSAGGKRAVTGLQGVGFDFEAAVATVAAAAKNDVAPKTVEQLTALASANLEERVGKQLAGGRRAKLLPEDEAFNRFVQAKDPKARVELALQDELVARGVLGDAGGAKAGLIGTASIAAETARLRAAQSDNLASKEAARILDEFPGLATDQQLETGLDAASAGMAPAALDRQFREKFVEQELRKQNAGAISRMRTQGNVATAEAFYEIESAIGESSSYSQADVLRRSEMFSEAQINEFQRMSLDYQRRMAAAAERRGTPSIRSRPESER